MSATAKANRKTLEREAKARLLWIGPGPANPADSGMCDLHWRVMGVHVIGCTGCRHAEKKRKKMLSEREERE